MFRLFKHLDQCPPLLPLGVTCSGDFIPRVTFSLKRLDLCVIFDDVDVPRGGSLTSSFIRSNLVSLCASTTFCIYVSFFFDF